MGLDAVADQFVNRQMQPDLAATQIPQQATTNIESLKSITGETPSGTQVSADNAVSGFVVQITRYIPTEIVAVYVALLALIPTPSWVVHNTAVGAGSLNASSSALIASTAANVAAQRATDAAHAVQLASHMSASMVAMSQAVADAAQISRSAALNAASAAQDVSASVPSDGIIDTWLWIAFGACLVITPILQYLLISAKTNALGSPVGPALVAPDPEIKIGSRVFRKRHHHHHHRRRGDPVDFPWFPCLASIVTFIAWALYLPNSIIAHAWNITPYGASIIIVLVSLVIYTANAALNRSGVGGAQPLPDAPILSPNPQIVPAQNTLLYQASRGTISYASHAPLGQIDLATLDDSTIARLGFPPRPADGPDRDLWNARYGGLCTLVAPSLSNASPSELRAGSDTDNWAGAIAKAPQADAFATVEGRWTVPTVEPSVQGDSHVVFWVGIDGTPGANSDVVQGGVHCSVSFIAPADSTSTVRFFAEWAPDDMIELGGDVKVDFGDDVSVTVHVASPTSASVHFRNNTKGSQVLPLILDYTAPLSPQSGQHFVGNIAEWVAEQLYDVKTNDYAVLATFDLCTFTQCRATLNSGTIVTPTSSAAVQMCLEGRSPSVTADVTDGEVTCKFQHV